MYELHLNGNELVMFIKQHLPHCGDRDDDVADEKRCCLTVNFSFDGSVCFAEPGLSVDVASRGCCMRLRCIDTHFFLFIRHYRRALCCLFTVLCLGHCCAYHWQNACAVSSPIQ